MLLLAWNDRSPGDVLDHLLNEIFLFGSKRLARHLELDERLKNDE